MAYDRFLIAPYQSGLDKSLSSWLTPEDSFQEFKNVNIFRGKVVKRFGAKLTGNQLTSRARIGLTDTTPEALGPTDGAGNIAGNVAGGVYAIGQTFIIGAELFTVVALGNPSVMTTTGAATVHTFDTTTGAYVINGAAITTQAYFYPADIGITTPLGTAYGTVPGLKFKIGQQFSIGADIFTVTVLGTPGVMITNGAATTCTFNTTTGAYAFAGVTPSTQIYFYPTEPIMGITHYEKGPVNEHTTFAFDTQFVYKYAGSAWNRDVSFTGPFHGSNKQFFWSTNYLGTTAAQIALFTTNFNATVGLNPPATDDPIYYYNETLWADFSAYTKFNSDQDIVSSCKIIIAWKNRLLLLNTMEKEIAPAITNYAHPNRVRYSHNGNPFSENAWLQRRQQYGIAPNIHKADGGGYIDAPVEEQILSAAVIKDRLIVYMERSTWELAYTGNTGLPFVWKSISNDIGCESTFSTVNLEGEVVTVDTTGIYACNGVSIGRIDRQIPEEVFSFLKTTEGTARVHGIKDYFNNLIYWTFLDNASKSTHAYPDKVLVYNYDNKTWSIYDDTITTFGYFEQSTDKTWADPGTWADRGSWGSFYNQAKSRRIIAGNHQGYLFLVNNKKASNAQVLPIANITIAGNTATLDIPSHNLADAEFVKLEDENVTADNTIFRVIRTGTDTIQLSDPNFAGVYTGGGTLTKVSRINIQSKDWNPYIKTGDRVYLARMDFCIVNTGQDQGELIIKYNVDAIKGIDFVEDGQAIEANLGTNILEMYGDILINPLELYKDILWKTVYFQALGDYVNINITLTDEQMLSENKALAPFELQGMILYTKKEGR